MAGDEEQHDLVDELVGGEPLAVVLGVDQRSEQVVGGVRALPLDRFEHVRGHVVGRLHDLVEVHRRQDRFEPEGQRVRPVAELVAVGVGHAEHVGDHLEGQWEREVAHHLHPVAARLDRVERGVDHLLDARRELLDAPRREDLLHDAADAGVVGRVDVEDALRAALGAIAEDLVAQLGPRVPPGNGAVLDAEQRGAQEADAVVVAEQHPGPNALCCTGFSSSRRRYCGYGFDEKPGSSGLKVGSSATR